MSRGQPPGPAIRPSRRGQPLRPAAEASYRRSIGKPCRANFGFIQTGFPEDKGGVAVWPPLDREALSFTGEPVTYRELLLTGAATGLLSRLLSEAAAGEMVLRASPQGPPRDAVRAEAARFRRARHLESGEDLRVWLASRGLTLDDFDRYISRAVARSGASNEPGTDWSELTSDLASKLRSEPMSEPVSELTSDLTSKPMSEPVSELTSELLFAELACAGAWRAFADNAVRLFSAELLYRQGNPTWPPSERGQGMTAEDELWLAPAEVMKVLRPFGSFDPEWCDERLDVLRSRLWALDDAERRVRGSEAMKARLEAGRWEWALFNYDELPLRSQAAAMEALSCARADRLPAAEIARRAGVEITARRARREELPAGHAAVLDRAAEDEAVGPIETADGFSVLWLRQRSTHDNADPEMSARALAELLSEALERVATGAVRETGQL